MTLPPRGSLAAMDIERRVRELGGAARTSDLGSPRRVHRAVARLVSQGALDQHPAGCVAVPGADPDILRARQFGASLTCASAARAHGLALLDEPKAAHLAIPHRRGPALGAQLRAIRAEIHREIPALLTAAAHPGVLGEQGPPVVAPAEALARMLRCHDPIASIVAIDSALNRRVVSMTDIDCLLRGPGSPAARAVLAQCDPRSLSPAETVARVALRRAGLSVEPNCFLDGVGYVDLLVEGRVVVECDGFAYHSSRRAFSADRQRDRELQLQGFVALRFPAEEVLRDQAGLVTCVRAALVADHPWPGARESSSKASADLSRLPIPAPARTA